MSNLRETKGLNIHMYIHMNMAKTIMISNEVYNELKRRKGERSFSEIIKGYIESSPKKAATLGELIKYCSGLLPEDDNEYDEVLKDSRKKWDEWRERLERELKEEESS